MTIVTKGGDAGRTDGPDGRVFKDDPFCEAVGTLDELNAILGMCRKETWNKDIYTLLSSVQNRLLDIGAELYAGQQNILDSDVEELETFINKYEIPLSNFLIPKGTFHFARAVCRRAERNLSSIATASYNVRHVTQKYINRLSDCLFVMATMETHEPLEDWVKRK